MESRARIREYLFERLADELDDTWTASRVHPDRLGADARPIVHLSYAVGVGTTERHGTAKVDEGAVSTTLVRIRWCHKLRVVGDEGQTEDLGDALEAEAELIAAVLSEAVRPELSAWFERALEPRLVGDGTYVVGEVQLTVGHLLPLSGRYAPNEEVP